MIAPWKILINLLPVIAFAALVGIELRIGNAGELLGKSVPDFTLENCYGKEVSLSGFDGKEVVVIVFLGTECPLAKLYGPRLTDIQHRFADKQVQVLGVNSNRQDSLTELQAYVHRHEISFPMLKDRGNRFADEIGATRTPEAFVLDKNRVIRYHGRIDDQIWRRVLSRARGRTGVGQCDRRSVGWTCNRKG